MASSSSSTTTTTTTTTMVSTEEDSERRDSSNCYFPDCRKDANCTCEICLDSLNATLDLMPLSVQRSSLTKLSYASSTFKPTVESTPTSFDPDVVVTTPASVSRPISRVISQPKKKVVKKPKEKIEKERKTLTLVVVMKVVLAIGLVLCLELVFGWVVKGVLKPEFSEEIVRVSGERSQAANDLDGKMRISEDELKGIAKNGKFSSCVDSDSRWRFNQDGSMLNSKCVLYKSVIEEVSIWGWPLQTAGLFSTGFSSSSITVLSGRVTEWSEGKFGYLIHEANTSWRRTKWSTSVLQLDPNTWVLEYRLSSVMESSSLLSMAVDLLTRVMVQAAKDVNREVFWMFSATGRLYSEVVSEASTTMTPT
ncbi:hypothetical protein IGI04_040173 [Brassica rapa subsp. trilocularis]|uniref:Uncharacterized protein n=1 Tax=Brassica rapa subsp. trilocularis TaxID=1813537 RepID=A0ABQ7KM30_BRACM|nr:hypothetical protein IGI04_040173 [Brassica rapa subsp. trilocularis]